MLFTCGIYQQTHIYKQQLWLNIFINVHLLVYHISKQHIYLMFNFLKVQCDFIVCVCFCKHLFVVCVCVFHIFNSQNTIDSQCIWLLLHIFTFVIFMWYVTPPCHMWPFNCMHIYNMYYPVHTYLLFTAILVL